MNDSFYYVKGGVRQGPVSLADLKTLATQQTLRRTDKVWKDGMAAWQPAETVSEIFQGLPPDLEVERPPLSDSPPPAVKASHVTAHSPGGMALLSFFLPGVGQMICGQTPKGITLLIFSVLLNVLTAGLVCLVICPFAALDAYQVAKARNGGTKLADWDFMPTPEKPNSMPAILTLVVLVIVLTAISFAQQHRAAQDQAFDSMMSSMQTAGQ